MTFRSPAIFRSPPIPTPPVTTNAPLLDPVEIVLFVNVDIPDTSKVSTIDALYNCAAPVVNKDVEYISPFTPSPPEVTIDPVVLETAAVVFVLRINPGV